MLSGGAQAKNIFWQVGGGVGVTIGTTAHMEGTILSAKAIHLLTGASLNGRALSQTAVTLQKNKIVISSLPYNASKVFISSGNLDGWALESSQASHKGGSMNSASPTFNLGDDSANRQYRSILSFDTSSLPDDAVIKSATLKIDAQGFVGTYPFSTLGGLYVDVRKPFFGATASLRITDFQATPSAYGVAIFSASTPPVLHWYGAALNTSGIAYINLTGTTQFRLRFATATNNNLVADYLQFYSGNAMNTATRPQLVISYSVP